MARLLRIAPLIVVSVAVVAVLIHVESGAPPVSGDAWTALVVLIAAALHLAVEQPQMPRGKAWARPSEKALRVRRTGQKLVCTG